MGGTVTGGIKARNTNHFRYGRQFYKVIGHAGGKVSPGQGKIKTTSVVKVCPICKEEKVFGRRQYIYCSDPCRRIRHREVALASIRRKRYSKK